MFLFSDNCEFRGEYELSDTMKGLKYQDWLQVWGAMLQQMAKNTLGVY